MSFNFYFVVFFLLKPVILAKAQRSNAKQFVKIICKNHATCFCGLFIFALLLFFYFQIHAVCVKKNASHSDSCSQNNRSKNEISLSIITMIPLLDSQIKYLLLKAKDVELFYITLEFVFNLSISG